MHTCKRGTESPCTLQCEGLASVLTNCSFTLFILSCLDVVWLVFQTTALLNATSVLSLAVYSLLKAHYTLWLLHVTVCNMNHVQLAFCIGKPQSMSVCVNPGGVECARIKQNGQRAMPQTMTVLSWVDKITQWWMGLGWTCSESGY